MNTKLKVGDKVTRLIGGTIRMPLVVTEIGDGIITCGLYKFAIHSGAEIDEALGWEGDYPEISCLKELVDEIAQEKAKAQQEQQSDANTTTEQS